MVQIRTDCFLSPSICSSRAHSDAATDADHSPSRASRARPRGDDAFTSHVLDGVRQDRRSDLEVSLVGRRHCPALVV